MTRKLKNLVWSTFDKEMWTAMVFWDDPLRVGYAVAGGGWSGLFGKTPYSVRLNGHEIGQAKSLSDGCEIAQADFEKRMGHWVAGFDEEYALPFAGGKHGSRW